MPVTLKVAPVQQAKSRKPSKIPTDAGKREAGLRERIVGAHPPAEKLFAPTDAESEDPFHPAPNPECNFRVMRSSHPDAGSDTALCLTDNGFVRAAINAYNEHCPLTIRPDDVWLAIVTQFAFYVLGHPEELRSKFVKHEGQKELTVTMVASSRYSVSIDEMCALFEQAIGRELTDDISAWILPEFSTTTSVDRTVARFALMGTMKKYFSYKVLLMCGLPQVTLEGTVNDWIAVRAKAERLLAFELPDKKYMSDWLALLTPVLDNFVATAALDPVAANDLSSKSPSLDRLRSWWNRISHYHGGSGVNYVSGWITVFCVMSNDNETGKFVWYGGQRYKEWLKIDISALPPGFVSVPLKWNDNGYELTSEVLAGSMGYRDTVKDRLVSAQPMWFVLESAEDHGRSVMDL